MNDVYYFNLGFSYHNYHGNMHRYGKSKFIAYGQMDKHENFNASRRKPECTNDKSIIDSQNRNQAPLFKPLFNKSHWR